jgi:hypothetical protein
VPEAGRLHPPNSRRLAADGTPAALSASVSRRRQRRTLFAPLAAVGWTRCYAATPYEALTPRTGIQMGHPVTRLLGHVVPTAQS